MTTYTFSEALHMMRHSGARMRPEDYSPLLWLYDMYYYVENNELGFSYISEEEMADDETAELDKVRTYVNMQESKAACDEVDSVIHAAHIMGNWVEVPPLDEQ
jgi:hypothetical protein